MEVIFSMITIKSITEPLLMNKTNSKTILSNIKQILKIFEAQDSLHQKPPNLEVFGVINKPKSFLMFFIKRLTFNQKYSIILLKYGLKGMI